MVGRWGCLFLSLIIFPVDASKRRKAHDPGAERRGRTRSAIRMGSISPTKHPSSGFGPAGRVPFPATFPLPGRLARFHSLPSLGFGIGLELELKNAFVFGRPVLGP